MIRAILDPIRKRLRRKTDPVGLLSRIARPELRRKTLVHAGAHLGQERHRYEAAGFTDILWIEGSPETFRRLSETLEAHKAGGARAVHHAACALLTDRDGDERVLKTFTNDGMSSSLFSPTKESLERWPGVRETGGGETVLTSTLDTLLENTGHAGRADVLVVDVQGAELLVLRGADRALREASAVVCEISTVPYYEGGVLFPELTAFLAAYGYEPQSTPRRHGDMLFMRPKDVK